MDHQKVNRNFLTITIAAVFLIFILCAGISAAEQTAEFISGSKALLWVTNTNKDGTFNVYARKIGKKFTPVVQSMEGKPQALQAAGNKLHLIYESRDYRIFEMDTTRIDQGRNVPGKIIATCETTDFSGTKGAGILALVLMNYTPPQPAKTQLPESSAGKVEDSKAPPETPESTGELTAKTTITAAPTPHRCLYRNFGNQWKLVGMQPVANEQPENLPKIYLAFVKGSLYRLDVWKSPKDINQNIKLWRLQNLTQWVPVVPKPSGKPQPIWPPNGTPCGMLGISNRLVFVIASGITSKSASDLSKQITQLDVYSYNPETNEILAPSTIQQNDNNLTWPAVNLPQITRNGDNIFMLWKSDTDEMLAQSDVQGKVLQKENFTESIGSLPDPERIRKISEYFIWGIMILLGITILWPRPRTVPKPFSLPEGIRPGNLLLRLIAFLVDFIPFSLVSAFIFFTHEEMEAMSRVKWTISNLTSPETLGNIVSPESSAYFAIVAMGTYIFYGVLMEWRFGWTIGKRLMQMRVLGDEGTAPKLREAVLRNLTKMIELSVIAAPQLWIVGVLMVLFPIITRYNQRLGDMMGRTSVVNSKTVKKITPDQNFQSGDASSGSEDEANDKEKQQ